MANSFFLTGERRLRLGFRLALALAAFFLAALFAAGARTGLRAVGTPPAVAMLLAASLWIGAHLGLTILLRHRVDRRPWGGMALPPLANGRTPLLIGLAFGTALLFLVAGIQLGAGWIELTRSGESGMAAGVAAGLAGSIAVGFSEELLFRGYILQNLGEEMPFWAATLVAGVAFAVLHMFVGGFGLGFILSAVTMGAFFSITRILSGSLWFAIGTHAAWDWAQAYLVGLGAVNHPAQDHSLLHVTQHGPTWMVGEAPSIEGGLLFTLIFLAATAGACAYASLRRRQLGWHAPLRAEGQGNVVERAAFTDPA
ncbi:CPBP family intramembrane metalloprotease [Pendulispora rubella]|uniref:CPBP family intramembrane metalloprotease n=1 Tax=Pendulispora rubella TaxID=2741070 RepID=A0ABZ2L1K0_9BACT